MLRWSRLVVAFLVAGVMACEGPTGPQGNANVVSGTFSVADADYIDAFWYLPVEGGVYGHQAQVATVTVPAITSDIVSDGLVLVYVRTPTTSLPAPAPTHWAALPFQQIGLGGGYLMSLKYAYSVGTVRIAYLHERTDTSVAVPSVYTVTLPTYEFKYVAVAGEPAAQLAASVDLRDYEAVLRALGSRVAGGLVGHSSSR
jgi:hypothetical protein